MRKTDLSPDRQQLLVPLDSHPGALALVPPPTPTHLQLPNLRGEIAKAHEALGRLQASAASLPNPNLITRTLDRREAVRSSQIEGTSSDLDDVLTFEATGSDEGLPPDVVVTLNYVKALEYGLAKVGPYGVGALDIELIKELHARLMDGVRGYGDKPGELRTRQNWIGGLRIYDAKFVPPPPDRVKDCLEDLVRVLQYVPAEEDFYEVPLVMRIAIVHAQFETIHPFIDGNGRVGRILLPLMLAAEGYPPVYLAGFMKANQAAYYETLAAVQLKGEWTEWVRFVATGVEVACRESIQTAQELTALLAQWKERIKALSLRSDAAAYRLPELLIGTPVLTATRAAEALGIAFPAANRALAQLQEACIVEPLTDRKRNRVFVAKEVVELLSRPTLPERY
ncbi:Fic family protein [Geomonas paludis]|uniref:Cell division protein Fic n=1 Tax=Geomonas paludis TaxID=2740185 RepID=A0A6V8MV33_9BACT|nr:Fic family protein [Geomonas paludis]GFO63960.1 cell division protein Fic [Geomonas paludis]